MDLRSCETPIEAPRSRFLRFWVDRFATYPAFSYCFRRSVLGSSPGMRRVVVQILVLRFVDSSKDLASCFVGFWQSAHYGAQTKVARQIRGEASDA